MSRRHIAVLRRPAFPLFLVGVWMLCGWLEAAEPKTDPKDLDYLIKYLVEGGNSRVRAQCAQDIEKLGPAGKPAARALCLAMLDRSRKVREAATSALDRVDPDLALPVSVLARKREGDNHQRAVTAIAKMGQAASPATPLLIQHLRESLQEARLVKLKTVQMEMTNKMRAEQARMNQNEDPLIGLLQGIVNGLLKEYQDEVDDNEKQMVRNTEDGLPRLVIADLKALVKIGGDDLATAKGIAVALKSDEPKFRVEAIRALGEMDKKKASLRAYNLATMALHLRDPAPEVRLAAIKALGDFGDHAKKQVPLLKRMKDKDQSPQVRDAAASALDDISKR